MAMTFLNKFLSFFTSRSKALASGASTKEANVAAAVEVLSQAEAEKAKQQKKAAKQPK
jgi:hypothetical protein